ncbi:MAG: YhbD family protein [Coriobacteriales bacterium]|jgi:DNA-binding transcriptional MerR regulator|nr:YhbD family protein [Coriobacteriales bacterium]
MEEISKKELLAITGISYGQLYRWKREGLIPEGWFVKKAAFTGQETYFPREQVLARIKVIVALKDSASLEDIRKSLEYRERPRLTGAILEVMLQRPEAARIASCDFSTRNARIDTWVLVAGLIDAAVEAGIVEEQLLRLIEGALAADAGGDPTTGVPSVVGASSATGAQVSIAAAGEDLYYLTTSDITTLHGDANIRICASRQLQIYWDRARAFSAPAASETVADETIADIREATNEKGQHHDL